MASPAKARKSFHPKTNMADMPKKRITEKPKLNAANPSSRNAFRCELCPKWCFSKTELLVHKTIHTGKVFSCIMCSKKFCFENVLREHWRRSHNVSILATVKCCEDEEKCSASLKPYNIQALYSPMVSLLKGKLVYECEICPEVCRTRIAFIDHMNNHVGPYPFGCEICFKRFKDIPNLDRHMNSHAKEPCIKCPFCSHTFIAKSLVYKHISHVHSTCPYFECPKCPEIFDSCDNLVQHTCSNVS